METENNFIVYLGAANLTPKQHQRINTAIREAFSAKLAQLVTNGSIASILKKKQRRITIIDSVVAQLAKEVLVIQLLCS